MVNHIPACHISMYPGLLPYRGCLNQLLTQKYTHCSDHIRGHPRKKNHGNRVFFPSHETGYPTVFFSKLGVLNDFTMCFLLFIVSAWKLHSWRLSKYEPSIQELYLHFPKQHQDTWLTLNGWPASTNPQKTNITMEDQYFEDVSPNEKWWFFVMLVFRRGTVGGRNPAPPGMYKPLRPTGWDYWTTGWPDFFHEQ